MENVTLQNSINPNDIKQYFKNGVSYDQYRKEMESGLESNQNDDMRNYIELNQHRMNRLDKKLALSQEMIQSINSLKEKIYWVVLTEHWCGDAAQILPVLAKIAEQSEGKIELKLLYRDENLGLMDNFLTNGGRAIPKLIQLNDKLEIKKHWGPRPKTAQELVIFLKSNPESAVTYSEQLHKWYAKNNQLDIQKEVATLLQF
ncbi:thioredoxin family protein [Flavobacterium soyangense]|uniref:Thioredoxin family protein n=1 Tax=Flavobacterium soyangense TaxID=2023265 RepID=A0A930XVA5_9FLAO|nr:thioredoxin family protein [Flavobacterium soyangense]MBF2709440.1 thioredoxin family protein [Flavobacterium soyangense]